jgi:hypothetical protein
MNCRVPSTPVEMALDYYHNDFEFAGLYLTQVADSLALSKAAAISAVAKV